jgi:hypothetical protein
MTALTLMMGGALAALVGTVLSDLVSEEIRRRLDLVPRRLVRLAARRLPASVREERVDEWCAEIDVILAQRGATRLPITRLTIGVRFALGLFVAVPSMQPPMATSRRWSVRPAVMVGGVVVAVGLFELAVAQPVLAVLICEGAAVVVALRIALPAVARSRPATLAVTPTALLFLVDIARRLEGGGLPTWVGIATTGILMWQPYLVLRFLRTLPGLWRVGVSVICALTCWTTVLSPRPLSLEALLAGPGVLGILLLVLGASAVAAAMRQPSFTARYPLLMTGAGTTLLAVSVFNIIAGAMPGGSLAYVLASRVTALVALCAFLAVVRTPRWVRLLTETPQTPVSRI